MSLYAQKNYNEVIGRSNPDGIAIHQPKYRIAQTGCFLVAFCNLLNDEFQIDINPLDLNAKFRDQRIYIDVDDKILDDLGWQSITAAFPQIVVSGTGTGTPPSNNAIVKFKYDGGKTHFCAVYDVAKNQIIDSYDGQIKDWTKAGRGNPVAWACYNNLKPQPVVINPPAPTPVNNDLYAVPDGYGLSQCLKARGYPDFGKDARWDWLAKLNGKSSWTEFKLRRGDTIICPVYNGQELPGAAPAPEPVIAPAPEPVAETPPVAPPIVQPAPDWRETYVAQPGTFMATKTILVGDIEGKNPMISLPEGTKVSIAGTFIYDGVSYYRGVKHAREGKWYGIPATALEPWTDEPKPAPAKVAEPDDDPIFNELLDDLSLKDEIKEFRQNLTGRERLVAVVAKVIGIFTKMAFWKTKKGK